VCPSAIVFDLRRGAGGDDVVTRLARANPDGTPGGTYEQPVTRAADIRNYDEMGSYPVTLTTLLATGAMVAFVITLFGVPRVRRRELAVLKTIGLAGRQVQAVLIAQAALTVVVAFALGVVVGIVAGRLTWLRFATNIGVVAHPTVPVLTILAIGIGATLLCTALSLIPSTLIARTPAARMLGR
jgi:predicted lysophospholipase L1 biosynthesis ABC-type transport system permease subunit